MKIRMKHVAVFVVLVAFDLGIWALVDKEGMLRWVLSDDVVLVSLITIIFGTCAALSHLLPNRPGRWHGSDGGSSGGGCGSSCGGGGCGGGCGG